MPGSFFAWAICSVTSGVVDQPYASFDGQWHTTIGMVKLEQTGAQVTGSYGPNGQFSLKGTGTGKTLLFEYAEGQAKGEARFTIGESPHAFMGRFQVAQRSLVETGTAGVQISEHALIN